MVCYFDSEWDCIWCCVVELNGDELVVCVDVFGVGFDEIGFEVVVCWWLFDVICVGMVDDDYVVYVDVFDDEDDDVCYVELVVDDGLVECICWLCVVSCCLIDVVGVFVMFVSL